MSRVTDLTGRLFGRLRVLERAANQVAKSGRQRSAWLCQCACGKRTTVTANNLTGKGTNRVQSCGCARVNSGRRPRKPGDLSGPEIKPRHRQSAADAAYASTQRAKRLAAVEATQPRVVPPHLRPAPTWRGIESASTALASALGLATRRVRR